MLDDERIERLSENFLLALRTKRGRFYPDKNFGSKVNADLSENEILAYIRQAVSALDGVCVKSIEKTGKKVTFNLMLNEEERQVIIEYV